MRVGRQKIAEGRFFGGYMFVDRLDIVRAALVGALAGVLCDLVWRAWEFLHTRHRVRRITPAQLCEKTRPCKKVIVLNLWDLEEEEDTNGSHGTGNRRRAFWGE